MYVFDKFSTSSDNPTSGLFICEGCGEIIPLTKEEKFPPCTECGDADWIMIAKAGEAGEKYPTGKNSPKSGLFLCTNCKKQVIPIAKGNNFPPCALCRTGPKWQLVVSS